MPNLIQQRLIDAVPPGAHDAVLFNIGALEGTVALVADQAGAKELCPVITVCDPAMDQDLKAVRGESVADADLSDEQQVLDMAVQGVTALIERNGLNTVTAQQVQPALAALVEYQR